MASIIQLRRDTAANWTAANTLLAQGELGVETDTSKVKLGNGSTTWNSLAYLIGASGSYLTAADIGVTVQAYDADLTAIGAISATTGLLKKTAANTWSLDTSAYITGNQTITFTGDATGSGTTSVTLTLGNSGVTAGTYKSVTVDAKGRVTAGTNPTTLSGYGITDAVNATAGSASGITLNDGYTEEVFAVTGTTPTLSPTNGSIQTWTLTANSTPTAGTWASGQSITLMIDDGTASLITWTSLPVTWKTDSGAAPTLNTTGITAISLWKVGTTIYGARVGNA